MRASGASLCLGTDSNARISMLEEMRWCEYGQRLRDGRRGACTDDDGRIDRSLMEMATHGGAKSLGLAAGVLEAGALADVARIDLRHMALQGVDANSIANALITGADVPFVAGSSSV